MKKLFNTLSHFFLFLGKVIYSAYHYAKGFTRMLYGILLFLCIGGILFFLQALLIQKTETVAYRGGSLTEGLVGSPVSIDPLSSTTETEHALSLVFFRGVDTMASSITFNENQTVATVTLRNDLVFHDRKPLTADDVLFTYERARFSDNQSALFYALLENMTITKENTYTLTFTSPTPIDTSFFQLGIIPKHIWEKESISEKEQLIGSGPFKVTRVVGRTGEVRKVVARRFAKYSEGAPYLRKVHFVFYENTNALMSAIENGAVDGATVEANEFNFPQDNFSIIPTANTVMLYATPRYNGIFSEARISLLEQMIDKNEILAIVRNSYGSTSGSHTPSSSEIFTDEAKRLLGQRGVTFTGENTVLQAPATTLYLRDDPELTHTAQLLQNYYGILGLPIELKIFSRGVFREELEKNPSALVLGYTTDPVLAPYRSLFPLYSLGVGRYARYTTEKELSLLDTQRRYEDIHTWSLRKELQWKKNRTENN